MDIIGAITSIEPIDLLVFFALFGMFILGFMQGIIRRLLGTASILISLLVAAQIRAPLGDFLARNWTQYPAEYNYMIAFGTVFLAGSIAATIAIQLFYRPLPLFAQYPIIDEVLGGVIGLIEAGLILGAFFLITDPFFLTVGVERHDGRVPVRPRDPWRVRRLADGLDRPRPDRAGHPVRLRGRLPARREGRLRALSERAGATARGFPREALAGPALDAAEALLGALLVRDADADDPAMAADASPRGTPAPGRSHRRGRGLPRTRGPRLACPVRA